MTDETPRMFGEHRDDPRSHREMAAQIAHDVANAAPDAEYTLQYLMAGMIHACLAIVDELEEVTEALVSLPVLPVAQQPTDPVN